MGRFQWNTVVFRYTCRSERLFSCLYPEYGERLVTKKLINTVISQVRDTESETLIIRPVGRVAIRRTHEV